MHSLCCRPQHCLPYLPTSSETRHALHARVLLSYRDSAWTITNTSCWTARWWWERKRWGSFSPFGGVALRECCGDSVTLYRGVKLGSDHWRMISTAAKEAIWRGDFVKDRALDTPTSHTSSRSRKRKVKAIRYKYIKQLSPSINHIRQCAKEGYFQSLCPIIRPRIPNTIFNLRWWW